ADVLAAAGVVGNADLAQLVGLVEEDGILVAGSAAGPQCDCVTTQRTFQVARRGAGDVPADLVQRAGQHGMHRIVVVHGDGLAGRRLEAHHGHGLVGDPVVVGALPPAIGDRV